MNNASSILRDPKAVDLQSEFGMSDNQESIIPNAILRFAGKAYLSSKDGAKKSNVGSVVETDQGALLLWLCAV